jgi:N6-L-threonylcarbamoyladenine synthase
LTHFPNHLLYVYLMQSTEILPLKKYCILGIESSCDDTSVAVVKGDKLLCNLTASQEIHLAYGGVVPELASRAHQSNIVPIIQQALEKAKIRKEDVDAIAYTRGPGLLGSLMVGASFAKGLALSWNKPLLPVNHLKAHIFAHFIQGCDAFGKLKPEFPFLALTVSGGHTQLLLVKSFLKIELLGETIDDAAGEAFDKVGKMLGLPYPAGPLIDSLASKGNPAAFSFPIAKAPGLNFSFSGLKTSVLRFLSTKTTEWVEENKADICASFQSTVIESLCIKVEKAMQDTGCYRLIIGGGVAANEGLRKALRKKEEEAKFEVHLPERLFCTDNGAMIAITGALMLGSGETGSMADQPLARWPVNG